MSDSTDVSRSAVAGPVLVVGAGPFQLGLIRSASELGVEVVVVDKNRVAPGMVAADVSYPIDVRDLDAVLGVAGQHSVRAVATAASDAALPAVAHVAEQLGLSGPSLDDVLRCTDKLRAHDALLAAGLPVPETRLVRCLEEVGANLRELPSERVVIKPRRGAGGRGVSTCSRTDDPRAALTKAAACGDPKSGVLLQEFVEGVPVGLEAFFFRGELVRAFVMDDQFVPGFASPVGHSLPSTLSADMQQAVVSNAGRVAAALGLSHGALNFDVRIRDGEVVVLEVNPRLGGNSISELVRLAYGVDLHRAALLVAYGVDPVETLKSLRHDAAAARLLISEHHGSVRLTGALPEGFDAFVEDGGSTGLHVDHHAILGRVVCGGATPEKASERALALCDAASRNIVVGEGR